GSKPSLPRPLYLLSWKMPSGLTTDIPGTPAAADQTDRHTGSHLTAVGYSRICPLRLDLTNIPQYINV
ncbi:MAG: hypothetical protein P8107_14420, partial [Spirochaetia bacterium]